MNSSASASARPVAARPAFGRAFFSGTAACPIYVDHLPARAGSHHRPVVMVHGGCHTGQCYLATPDGREGWAPRFAADRDVFVVDWPGHGRSPACEELASLSTQGIAESILVLVEQVGPAVLLVHSASGPMAWWIAERAQRSVAAVLGIAPGAPANILAVLPEDREAVARLSNDISLGCPVMTPEDRPVSVGDAFMRDFWANAPRFPRHAFDQYRLSIVPESARLFNERFNIGGRGLRIGNPASLAQTPILIVTGDHDPRHPRAMDEATARYVGAEFLWLPDEGIEGNGHMPMIEDNSDAIAGRLLRWLDERGL
ncbi:alpha/beta fold hydrolase [uncultured Bosea sp.]|uniref:alpha/beta fold hydrolase n=1 Tax=uncultured Bosea sp. TaxID=211457 RepID=UPI0025E70DDA|nr:alpha/beta fold hydrolase [uncultured Bosea sp.]